VTCNRVSWISQVVGRITLLAARPKRRTISLSHFPTFRVPIRAADLGSPQTPLAGSSAWRRPRTSPAHRARDGHHERPEHPKVCFREPGAVQKRPHGTISFNGEQNLANYTRTKHTHQNSNSVLNKLIELEYGINPLHFPHTPQPYLWVAQIYAHTIILFWLLFRHSWCDTLIVLMFVQRFSSKF
jgi:hypothetical protein